MALTDHAAASMTITGYARPWSVRGGESVELLLSTSAPSYSARVVRMLHGDAAPGTPGLVVEPVTSPLEGEHPGVDQPLRRGSYAHSDATVALDLSAGLTSGVRCWPTAPQRGHRQTLVAVGSADDFSLVVALDGDGHVVAECRGGDEMLTARTSRPVRARTWYGIVVRLDTSGLALDVARLEPLPVADRTLLDGTDRATAPGAAPAGTAQVAVWAAARPADGIAVEHYDGKLEAPWIAAGALSDQEASDVAAAREPIVPASAMLAWDFSIGISSWAVSDRSGNHHEGTLVNMPLRAVTGSNWAKRDERWSAVPEQYGAIHFHADDLGDAGWSPSLRWEVPTDTPSGVYAVELTADGFTDYVPFFVRPATGSPTADAALLMPTFSYLAYANDHMVGGGNVEQMLKDIAPTGGYPSCAQDRYVLENRLNSLYDLHSDGSGVAISSPHRPLVTMRPLYHHPRLAAARQFNADLHIVHWFRHHGIDHDVVTDHDLDREGVDAISPYRLLVTGSHPEYWSAAMLDAVERFLATGGRMIYLGGNGLYWVTAPDPSGSGAVEIRRASGIRTWEAPPGERHLAFTGELGGLWRDRDRAPQRTVGVGMAAWGRGPGRPYMRSAESRDARVSWAFDGIDADEVGGIPSAVNEWGAAGFEFDRADRALGTPDHALIVASATGFSARYQHTVEEVLVADSKQSGDVEARVRCDMVFFETANGGAVFSTGSVQWGGCLAHDGYDNDVSRLTLNVVRRFLDERPLGGVPG